MFWTKHENVTTTASGIHIESAHEDKPEFRRVYTKTLNERATLKVEVRSFLSSRLFSGELTQPNGRWVRFEVERPADKILDPVLVPLVEAACAEIQAIDREFIRSNPGEYIDENGAVWRRVG